MSRFLCAYEQTMKLEGGYANHPSDKGGETWAGIARKYHPSWPGWPIIDSLKKEPEFPRNLKRDPQLEQLKLSFYRKNFWDSLLLDQIKSPKVQDKLFDIAVNCGVSFAAKALQRVLNVANQRGRYYPDLVVDGKIGQKTIAAANAHPNPDVIFKALNVLQGNHYISITESREANEDFFNGWFQQRIASVLNDNNQNLA